MRPLRSVAQGGKNQTLKRIVFGVKGLRSQADHDAIRRVLNGIQTCFNDTGSKATTVTVELRGKTAEDFSRRSAEVLALLQSAVPHAQYTLLP